MGCHLSIEHTIDGVSVEMPSRRLDFNVRTCCGDGVTLIDIDHARSLDIHEKQSFNDGARTRDILQVFTRIVQQYSPLRVHDESRTAVGLEELSKYAQEYLALILLAS